MTENENVSFTGSDFSKQESLIEFIKQVVCKYYGQPIEALDRRNRKNEIVKIRQICMYLTLKNCRISLEKVGEKIGNKDHSTVIHANKTIKGYLEWDTDLRKEVDELQKIIVLKANITTSGVDLNKDFYYVDLNDFTSFKISKDKAVILTGFAPEEAEHIRKYLFPTVKGKGHKNTGMYILDKNIDENNENKSESI